MASAAVERRPIECDFGSPSSQAADSKEGKERRNILLIRKIVEVDNPTVTPQLLEYLKTSSCLEVILTFITRPKDANPLFTENSIDEEDENNTDENAEVLLGRDGLPEDIPALKRSYRAMILLTSPSKAFEDTFTSQAIMDLIPKLFAGLNTTSKCNLNHWSAVLSALVQREPAAVVRTVEMFGLLEPMMEHLHEPPVMAAALDMIMGGNGKLKGGLGSTAASKLSCDSALAQLYNHISLNSLLVRSQEWLADPEGYSEAETRHCSISSFWLQYMQRMVAERPYAVGLLVDEADCQDLLSALGGTVGLSPCVECRRNAATMMTLLLRWAHEVLDAPPDDLETPRVSLCSRAGGVACALFTAASAMSADTVHHLCRRLGGGGEGPSAAVVSSPQCPATPEVGVRGAAGAAGEATPSPGGDSVYLSPMGSTPGSSGGSGRRGRRRARRPRGGSAVPLSASRPFTLESAEVLSALAALITLGPPAVRDVTPAAWSLLADWFFSAHLASQLHTRFFWIAQALLSEKPRGGLQDLYTAQGARFLSRLLERLPTVAGESARCADTCAFAVLHLNLLRLTAAAEGAGGWVHKLLAGHHGWQRAADDVREMAMVQARPMHPMARALGAGPVPLAPRVPSVMGRANKEFRKSKSRRETMMEEEAARRGEDEGADGGVDLGSRYARALGVLEDAPAAGMGAGGGTSFAATAAEGGAVPGSSPATPVRPPRGTPGGVVGSGSKGALPFSSPLQDRTNHAGIGNVLRSPMGKANVAAGKTPPAGKEAYVSNKASPFKWKSNSIMSATNVFAGKHAGLQDGDVKSWGADENHFPM